MERDGCRADGADQHAGTSVTSMTMAFNCLPPLELLLIIYWTQVFASYEWKSCLVHHAERLGLVEGVGEQMHRAVAS